MQLTEFCRKIPKVDIHYHLLGGVRLETMLDLAKKYQVELSEDDAKAYYRAHHEENKPVKGGIAALRLLYSLMQECGDYQRVLSEVADDACAVGVRYLELFWNPSDTELSYRDITLAMAETIDKIEQTKGMVIRLIPSINREKSPEEAYLMVQKMAEFPHPYVVGIGIDYQEDHAPVEHFWKAYRYAKRLGYRLTAHCSEFGLHSRNVESATDLLGIERIDHGYTVIENLELCQKMVDRQIPFTVVPSNTYYYKKWQDYEVWRKEHPIREMGKRGLMIIPTTDDWHIHNTNTAKCFETMVKDFGFDPLSLKTLMLNGLIASFLPESIKTAWIKEWSAEFDELYEKLEPVTIREDLFIQYR